MARRRMFSHGGRVCNRSTKVCGGSKAAEGGRGSGVVPPSKDDQGLDVNGASADQQSPERAAQPANVFPHQVPLHL